MLHWAIFTTKRDVPTKFQHEQISGKSDMFSSTILRENLTSLYGPSGPAISRETLKIVEMGKKKNAQVQRALQATFFFFSSLVRMLYLNPNQQAQSIAYTPTHV